ncbi:caspase-3 [Nephila pilipes]|uniref:Caspase-3 n=1 Tax=Nephila pilipes TaxID=299642 RepID=A0A8X6U4K1_NEPPI|nr:caspase-3 [Nephila pilipes]
MLKDINDQDAGLDFYDELCSRGPHAFSMFVVILKKAGYQKIAEKLEELCNIKVLAPYYYKMDSKPIGYCLIIINEIFDDPRKNRRGSKVDAYALENLFQKLNYEVTVEWNKNQSEMYSILYEFSQHPGFKEVDSCVVYILTHGGNEDNRDFLLGIDEEEVYLDEIFTMFNNQNCESLIGKPKIFFFQACRGDIHDRGVNIKTGLDTVVSQESEISSSTDASDFSNLDIVSNKISHSTFSDIIIVHSTLPHHKSWKHHDTGSWLCEDLVHVVSNHYHDFDLGTMLTIVSHHMQKRVSIIDTKQAIHVETLGVTGLVHFNRK